MALNGPRLNTARYTSLLSDIAAQFGTIPAGLQASEIAQITSYRQKLAHAIGDNEGTDVVAEITGNAVVPTGIAGTVTSGPGSGGATITTAPGTVT
mgnify:CR=1 FL=1